MSLRIFYDEPQEGLWARRLDPDLAGAPLELLGLPSNPDRVLALLHYDRPDIVIAAGIQPILVLERSGEVPSGHNVGQRFGRIVSAAQERVPMVYFFPFAAYKHGGETQGPRYVNLRVFDSIDRLETVHDAFVQPVSWPTDDAFELLHGGADIAAIQPIVREILAHVGASPSELRVLPTVIQARAAVTEELKRKATKNPEYLSPPPSVEIGVPSGRWLPPEILSQLPNREIACVYRIGMTYVRADPYTGNLMLYDYLYARTGPTRSDRSMHLVAHMPSIDAATWTAAAPGSRKDVRSFTTIPDAIVLRDSVITIP